MERNFDGSAGPKWTIKLCKRLLVITDYYNKIFSVTVIIELIIINNSSDNVSRNVKPT